MTNRQQLATEINDRIADVYNTLSRLNGEIQKAMAELERITGGKQ